MPYYGIPVDQTSENVGMGFNKLILDIEATLDRIHNKRMGVFSLVR